MIAITGASGQLGRLVIEALLKTVPAAEIVAAVRHPQKAADLAARGIQVRLADYDKPDTLVKAFQGVDQLLLISANEIGRRVPQHRAVIDAAKKVKIGLLVYTSILHADHSPLPLASEHKQTEDLIHASGIPFTLLRNGWYSENYLASTPTALQYGALLGCAGDGRIASAARADYADAAATVLTRSGQAGRIYELAGDDSYTLTELANTIAKQSGKPVTYQNLPEAEYKTALLAAGLPEAIASLLSESDTGAAQDGLFDNGHQLSQLIGHPTTPIISQIASAVKITARLG